MQGQIRPTQNGEAMKNGDKKQEESDRDRGGMTILFTEVQRIPNKRLGRRAMGAILAAEAEYRRQEREAARLRRLLP